MRIILHAFGFGASLYDNGSLSIWYSVHTGSRAECGYCLCRRSNFQYYLIFCHFVRWNSHKYWFQADYLRLMGVRAERRMDEDYKIHDFWFKMYFQLTEPEHCDQTKFGRKVFSFKYWSLSLHKIDMVTSTDANSLKMHMWDVRVVHFIRAIWVHTSKCAYLFDFVYKFEIKKNGFVCSNEPMDLIQMKSYMNFS